MAKTAAPDLPLFGRAPMGTPAVDRIRDEMDHRVEGVLCQLWGNGGRITIDAARDPLGEWWVSTWWSLSTIPEQNGAIGGMSPLWPTGLRDRTAAVAKVASDLAAMLPSYRGKAGKEVARIRAALDSVVHAGGTKGIAA